MQTPWGEIPVSDAHVHFFSSTFLSALAAQSPSLPKETANIASLLGWSKPRSPEELASDWVAELDRHGVSRAALIASLPGDEASVETAVRAFPDRFYGYFMVNPVSPGAVSRMRAGLEGGHLRGICLFPAMHRFSVADESVDPILQAASSSRAVVFVHCGVLSVGFRKKLGLPSPFDLRFSNPLDVHPVALRYPNVRFVIPHFGAGFFREALMVCDLCPNVYLDTSSTNSWTRYLAPSPDLSSVFRSALQVAGPRRLLFGTDSSFFPRGWNGNILQEQLLAMHKAGITHEDAQRILGENLAEVLAPPLVANG
jgi:predicted TIM-barrel fold metal-dependent hydrolase